MKTEFAKDTLTIPKRKREKGSNIIYSLGGGMSLKEKMKNKNMDSSCYLVISPKQAWKKGYISWKEYKGGNGRKARHAMGFRAYKRNNYFIL